MTVIKDLYFRMKQPCFSFLPEFNSYITSSISRATYGYYYGAFTGYRESGVDTDKKHIIKLNVDLSIDTSFDVGIGFNQILYSGSSILEQPDGKIIVTGTFTSYKGVSAQRIIRLNPDGSNDNTMGAFWGGLNYTQVPALQSDGKIIVTNGCYRYRDTYGEHWSPMIARLNADGTYDNTFVVGNGFNQPTLSVVSNSDKSMIITGYFGSYKGVACSGGIIKLDQYGEKDNTFNSGVGFYPYGPRNPNYVIKAEGETSFYVHGYFTSYKGVSENHIIKIQQNGDKDTSFITGTGLNGISWAGSIIWNDKVFLEGAFTTYNGTIAAGLIILNADGSVLFAPQEANYDTPIIIGDSLYAKDAEGCLMLMYKLIQR